MAGWFLDILIGYLIRFMVRMVKARGSHTWPLENATVSFSNASNGYGGPIAEVGYTYSYQGRFFSGGYRKPFILHNSAKRYVAVLLKGTHIIVRVKPGQPETSIVSDKDQDQAAMKLRARFD
jgi:hypothetical protein